MHFLSLKKIILLILMPIAFGLTIWSFILSQSSSTSSTLSSTQPDAFLEKINAVILNKMGEPALKIQSNEMIHFAENDVTQIQNPHILFYRQSPQPWQINALQATAIDGMHTIQFFHHVVIQNKGDIHTNPTTLSTEALTVFPETEKAETGLPVLISQPNAVMQGVGMKSDLATGTIQLLAQIRGRYVPNT